AVDEEDRDGEAAIVYALETTAQRTLENRFQQQQKMESVGQLAGGIAHDFNNVLSAIMMATDFLLNAHKPTDPSFQDIMQIKQNANRAASLVRQLLAFSRRQTLRPQVLDLGEVLEALTVLLRRLLGEKVVVEVVPGRDSPTAYGIEKQTGDYVSPGTMLAKGTTFRIFLPRHIADAAAVEEVEAAARAAIANAGGGTLAKPATDLTGHGTILLVEDED